MENLKEKLQQATDMEFFGDETTNLQRNVIMDLLENADLSDNDTTEESNEKILTYMTDIVNHGCVSGVVSSMIYYADTEKFFDENVDDILSLIEEKKQDLGEFLFNSNFEINRNNLAWWAYEVTVSDLLMELE